MITYIGSMTIGGLMPPISGALAAAFTDLQARVSALVAAQATFSSPSYVVQIQMLTQMIANIQALISLGIPPPTLSLQISLMVALVADLEAQLAIILNIQNLLGTSGVHAYAFAGRADALGLEFSSELATGFPGGSPSDYCNALVLATTIPATWAAIAALFKVTP